MHWNKLILIDPHERRRSEIYRAMAPHITTLPVAGVRELGRAWSETTWFMVADQDDLFADLRQELARAGRFNPIVIFADTLDSSRMIDAILAGVCNFVQWPCPPEQLLESLERGEERARRRWANTLRKQRAREKLRTLSQREGEVLRLMRDGLTNKGIGRRLGISDRTVEIHRSSAIRKLDATHSMEATAILIDAEDDLDLRLAI